MIFVLICIIPVMILGFISYKKAYNILSDKLKVTAKQNLLLVNKSINNYFKGMEATIQMLSTNGDFQQLEVHPEFEQFALGILRDVKNSNSDLLAVYFGQRTKKMVLYPEQKLPDDFDPTSRSWYQKAVQNPDKVVFSDPYKDTATGDYVISISKVVKYDGQVTGVIAMDVSLASLTKQLSDIKIGQNGYAYITAANGMMIAHPDKSIIGTDIATKQTFWGDIKTNQNGFTRYIYNGQNKFASYDTNILTGWKLMSSLDEKELLYDTDVIRNLTVIVILIIGD